MFKRLWDKLKGKSAIEKDLEFYRPYITLDNIELFKNYHYSLGLHTSGGYSQKTENITKEKETIHPLQIYTTIYDAQVKGSLKDFKPVGNPLKMYTINLN